MPNIPDKKYDWIIQAISIFDNANKSSRAKITAFTVEENNVLTNAHTIISQFSLFTRKTCKTA